MSSPEFYPVLVTEAVTLNTGSAASATTAAVDTVVNGQKANRATFIIPLGTIASGGGLSVCKVQSSSTSGGSYADISGASITSIGDGDDDTIAVIDIDLAANGCDRFLDLVLTTAGAVNTDINAVTCILSDFSVEPPYDDGLAAIARV